LKATGTGPTPMRVVLDAVEVLFDSFRNGAIAPPKRTKPTSALVAKPARAPAFGASWA
jgi:hypothetical protein